MMLTLTNTPYLLLFFMSLLSTFFMSLFLSSVTSYLELRNAISVYCISRILPADIKLVVWTVLIETRITTILSKTLHQ